MSDHPEQLTATSIDECTVEIDDGTWALLCYFADLIPISVVPFAVTDISAQYPGHPVLEVLGHRQRKFNEARQSFGCDDIPDF